jgi:hypothetical protein
VGAGLRLTRRLVLWLNLRLIHLPVNAKVFVSFRQNVLSMGHFPPGAWHGATMLDEEVILVDIFSPIRQDFLAN